MSNFIMGKNTVLEVLKHKEEIVLEVYSAKDKNDPVIKQILNKKIQVKFVSKNNLNALVDSQSHQNIAAKIKSRNYWNLKDFLAAERNKSKSLVLMLDNIFDPQNFGSILRTCECFSVDGVIFSKNRGTDITPTVTKAAAGATEFVNLIKVSNLANCLDDFTKEGYKCVATALDENSADMLSFDFPDKTLLIMGSEGEGIQELILKKSDVRLRIGMTGKLQSLNVSNAAAVLLFYIRFAAS